MLRDKFEDQRPPKLAKPMILAKSKNDLYENISDDFLNLRSNSMRAKAERMAKCNSVPLFMLQPDEQYRPPMQTDGFMQRRNQWSTASYQRLNENVNKQLISSVGQRNCQARRSMSILDDYDKENCIPDFLPPKPCLKTKAAPPPLRPKLKAIEVMRGSPKAYRLSSGATLSPQSKIFAARAANLN